MTFTLPRVLFAGLVMTAFLVGAAWGSTQLVGAEPVSPTVYSGADIGFRMTAQKRDTPVGRLVIRVNGQWKEVEFTFALKPISQ
jgi:hypothetical protein